MHKPGRASEDTQYNEWMPTSSCNTDETLNVIRQASEPLFLSIVPLSPLSLLYDFGILRIPSCLFEDVVSVLGHPAKCQSPAQSIHPCNRFLPSSST